MKHYKCQKCEFIFSDADKVISDASPVGVCPQCAHPLIDHAAKLASLKKLADASQDVYADKNNPNYFKCGNCRQFSHVSRKANRGLYLAVGLALMRFRGGVFINGICDGCIYQFYFVATIPYVFLFFVFIWPEIHGFFGL
jgi:DNA-directed RNA polymerase subunit RPC12/RpoP